MRVSVTKKTGTSRMARLPFRSAVHARGPDDRVLGDTGGHRDAQRGQELEVVLTDDVALIGRSPTEGLVDPADETHREPELVADLPVRLPREARPLVLRGLQECEGEPPLRDGLADAVEREPGPVAGLGHADPAGVRSRVALASSAGTMMPRSRSWRTKPG